MGQENADFPVRVGVPSSEVPHAARGGSNRRRTDGSRLPLPKKQHWGGKRLQLLLLVLALREPRTSIGNHVQPLLAMISCRDIETARGGDSTASLPGCLASVVDLQVSLKIFLALFNKPRRHEKSQKSLLCSGSGRFIKWHRSTRRVHTDRTTTAPRSWMLISPHESHDVPMSLEYTSMKERERGKGCPAVAIPWPASFKMRASHDAPHAPRCPGCS